MSDRDLVEALRSGDPGAVAVLYDTYAEGIYRYCWTLLRNTDSAQVALRDALIAAEAHAAALSDPDLLRPWLYALARGECLRRRMADLPDAGETLAEAPEITDPDDADLRVVAWNAVQSLPTADRETLELNARHGLPMPHVAAVLGVTARQAETAHEAARDRLRDAITVEFLARKGPYDCPRRARILTGFAGELTAGMREQLVAHVARCETCAPHRNRQVSAAKVYELLPQITLPDVLRVRVLSCFVDPELHLYRRYVARRSEALDAAGFPVAVERGPRKWPRALAGALAAVATLVAIATIFDYFGKEVGGLPGVASVAFPPQGEPPGLTLPWSDRRQVPGSVEVDSTATRPLGVTPATAGQQTPSPQPPVFTPIGGDPEPVPSTPPPTGPDLGDPTLDPVHPVDPVTPPPGKPRPSGKPPVMPSPQPDPTPAPTPTTPTPSPKPSPKPTAKPTGKPTSTATPPATATPTESVSPSVTS
ncbi:MULTISPECIES: sigma-70 family RNA polymerase sigma factor [Nonomuraea]|uniref:RNA polymerase sigma factor n=1 Tax=Nonomuraea TaxID=83681 RepID=UPI001C5CF570|nr:sigma-70 family RNA polymerase sigma factor [Nonomuraea ceibae]